MHLLTFTDPVHKLPLRGLIQLKVFGDEFYSRFERADGFSVVKDPESGWFCYAELSADGEYLVSTESLHRIFLS